METSYPHNQDGEQKDVQSKTNDLLMTTDVEGVAARTGRSVQSVFRDDDAGRIPRSVRIGASRRWIIAEIESWLLHGCPPRDEWATIWADLRRDMSIARIGNLK